jgi:hypothetical protein
MAASDYLHKEPSIGLKSRLLQDSEYGGHMQIKFLSRQ